MLFGGKLAMGFCKEVGGMSFLKFGWRVNEILASNRLGLYTVYFKNFAKNSYDNHFAITILLFLGIIRPTFYTLKIIHQ